MKKRVITEGIVNSFKRHLIESEKADATIQKYIHDIHYFAEYAKQRVLDKICLSLIKVR